MAIVFPGESGPDAESVAVSVAQATFMNYAFVIMPDRYEIDSSTSFKSLVQIIIKVMLEPHPLFRAKYSTLAMITFYSHL